MNTMNFCPKTHDAIKPLMNNERFLVWLEEQACLDFPLSDCDNAITQYVCEEANLQAAIVQPVDEYHFVVTGYKAHNDKTQTWEHGASFLLPPAMCAFYGASLEAPGDKLHIEQAILLMIYCNQLEAIAAS